jgi:hypothetical protein
MGQRLRLRTGFDVSGFPPQARAVLVALKRYGMILADNGSSWFITGAPSSKWDNDDLHSLAGSRARTSRWSIPRRCRGRVEGLGGPAWRRNSELTGLLKEPQAR